jgi:hypothetical protein
MTTDFDRYMNAVTDEELAEALAEITAGEQDEEVYQHERRGMWNDKPKGRSEE